MTGATNLRDVSRQAVRDEIAAVGERMFADRGYDAVTVEDLVEALGISQRTFFRYFPTKGDVMLASFDHMSHELVERVSASRSTDAWELLAESFEYVCALQDDPGRRARGDLAQQTIESSPTLLAAYLAKMDAIQRALTEAVSRKSGLDDTVARAVVGAAFACLQATFTATRHSADLPFRDELARVLTSVRAPG